MSTTESVMKQLGAAGREGTARVYRRHGVKDEVLGVSYAALGGIAKGAGVDDGETGDRPAAHGLEAASPAR